MALTQIKTDAISDDAVTLAKQAAGTDGQIITYDASGNPVAVGPGTDGQVLTSTGAGSPPAFETPASGTTINNNANNRVITGSGTADTLEGESNLTFDGSKLEVKTSAATANDLINAVNVNASTTGTAAAGVGTKMTFYGSMTGQNDVELGQIGFHNTNVSGAHGDFVVKTRPNGTSAERLRITSGGNVKIAASGADAIRSLRIDGTNGSSEIQGFILENDGGNGRVNLKYGTGGGTPSTKVSMLAGGGLTFNGDTAAANALDDYETGDWTPTFEGHNTAGSFSFGSGYGTGKYTKIGNLVTFTIYTGNMTISGTDGVAKITGLPFTSAAGNRLHNMFGVTHATCFDHDCSGGYVNPGATYGYFMRGFGTTSSNSWNGGGYLMMSGTYQID